MVATIYWIGGSVGFEGKFNLDENWSGGTAPVAGDSIHISGSQDIDDALDSSAIDVDRFVVESSYTGSIGSKGSPLEIGITDTTGTIEFSGSGEAHLDLGASVVNMIVHSTSSAGVGSYGLYVKGSAIAVLSVEGGKVGIAVDVPADTATITTLRCLGGRTVVGSGTTVTNVDVGSGARLTLRANCSDMDIRSGTVKTTESAAISSSVTIWGGRLIHNSTGTIASAIIQGGELDVSRGGLNVTVSSLKLNEGAFVYDPESVTVSSIVEADFPVRWTSSKDT